jgi:dienelactone hydrolase
VGRVVGRASQHVEDVATELLTEWVDHESSAGRYSAYLARPAPITAPMPGVVVIQEVWGVDAHIRNVAERFATAGLPAFAAALQSVGVDHALRIYADAPHAFFNDTRPSYRPEPARDAWARTLAFFAEVLGPVAPVPLNAAVKTV